MNNPEKLETLGIQDKGQRTKTNKTKSTLYANRYKWHK